ncbi:MAG: hypothetical protein J3K34DRAFT_522693 [Monoraphidium minutum]|nr:MAG: hypothetical protein J3K34DRAFT_522693 [Monoraphidium minutum]
MRFGAGRGLLRSLRWRLHAVDGDERGAAAAALLDLGDVIDTPDVLLVTPAAAQRLAPPSFDDPPPRLPPEDLRPRGLGARPGAAPARAAPPDRLLDMAPPSGHPSERRLAAMLAACASWQQLERLVAREAGGFNGVHATAAFGLLRRALEGEAAAGGGGGGDGGREEEAGAVGGAAAAEGAGAEEGAGSAAAGPGGGDQGGGGGGGSGGGEAEEAAAILQGPLSFGTATRRRRLTALTARLGRVALRNAGTLDGQAVAVALWCLGRLGYREPQLVSELLLLAGITAGALSGQGLAMVLGAAVALRVRPPPGVLARLTERLGQAAPLLGPQALANSLWALAKLQAMAPPPPPLPGGLLPALEARVRQELHRLGPLHTSMAFWALARLKARPSAATLEELWRRSLPQLPDYSPQDMCNLGWALAESKAAPPDAWAAAFCARCGDCLAAGGLEARGAVQVAYALARWGHLRRRKLRGGAAVGGGGGAAAAQAGVGAGSGAGGTNGNLPSDADAAAAGGAAARAAAVAALARQLLAWALPRLPGLPPHEAADLAIAASDLVGSGDAGPGGLPAGWAAAAAAAAAGGRLPPKKAKRLRGALERGRRAAPGRRTLAPPSNALALPSMDWADEAAAALQQMMSALFSFAPAKAQTRPEMEDIPEEYRADEPAGGHGSTWVNSHIATRLATAGDDVFSDH